MEIMTVGVAALALLCVVISILLPGAGVAAYLRPEALIIVLGGTLFAALATYSPGALKNAALAVRAVFAAKEADLVVDVEMVHEAANVARRRGIISLEEQAEKLDDPYIRRGVSLIVDGADPGLVREIMETELLFLRERHSSTQALFRQMASYSTAFGMIGTIIGMIGMLGQLGSANSFGGGMAAALVSMLVGALLANAVFTPLAVRLETLSEGECLRRELMIEGILAIADGENPRIIREKLKAFLSRRDTERDEAGESFIASAKRALFARQKRPQ